MKWKVRKSSNTKHSNPVDITARHQHHENLKSYRNLCRWKMYEYEIIEIIKLAPENILQLILKFLNLCLKEHIAPNDWHISLLSPIHKDCPKQNPDNYRGSCLMNNLLKVLCSILNNRLVEHAKQLSLINPEQIGFQENARTSDQILTDKKRKKRFACFIDFKKAFDSIRHNPCSRNCKIVI